MWNPSWCATSPRARSASSQPPATRSPPSTTSCPTSTSWNSARSNELETGLRLAAEGLLVALLALNAADRGGEGSQPLEADIAAAVDANAVLAAFQAVARGFERAEFVEIARQVRLLEVGEERSHGLVAAVRRRAGVLRVGVLPAALGILAQLGEQGLAALLDQVAEGLGLVTGERHRNLHKSMRLANAVPA